MNSFVAGNFWKLFYALPEALQAQARKQFLLWPSDHQHPSLHFKKVGEFWSVRVDDGYRALGRVDGDAIYWFWIGSHDDYERVIRRG